jgi:hypothetical protein
MPDTEDQPDTDATTAAPVAGAPSSVSREPWRPEPTWQRWAVPLALVIALVAVGLSVWSLVSPPSKSSSGGGGGTSQAGGSKQDVCAAFDTVSKAVSLRTHANLGPEPVAQEAVAANARLALVGGGAYLVSRVGSDTPAQVADAARSFGSDLQEIGTYALAGVSNSDQQQANRLTQADLVRRQLVDLCK